MNQQVKKFLRSFDLASNVGSQFGTMEDLSHATCSILEHSDREEAGTVVSLASPGLQQCREADEMTVELFNIPHADNRADQLGEGRCTPMLARLPRWPGPFRPG